MTFDAEGARRALKHRGPDGHGSHRQEGEPDGIRLVHTRLAIQDPSPAGAQPMASADGRLVISFNGEIYNFHELRRDLPGHGVHLRSRTDTEVLLEGWALRGPDFLDRCRGMFAFALWDRGERTLWLVRDRLGVKPLYYTEGNGGIAFASEVRALVQSGAVEPRLSPSAIAAFLTGGAVHDPDTAVAGVRSLPPGHLLRWRAGQSAVRSYWQLPSEGDEGPLDRRQASEEVRALLQSAVESRLVSDVPVALLLSSGIDSSAVATLAARARAAPLDAFTVRLDEEDQSLDEANPAREFAAALGLRHHEVRLQASDVVRRLDEAWDAMDQPTIDGVNTFFVTQEVHRRGMKVALSGLGGDEVFLGYPSAHSLLRTLRLARAMAPLWHRVRSGVERVGPRLFSATPLAAAKVWELPYVEPTAGSMVRLRRTLFPRVGRRALMPSLIETSAPPAPAEQEPFLEWSRSELMGYMGNLLLRDTDAFAMHHPVEVRVPLVDHLLVERVLRMPPDVRFVPGRQKALLVDAVARELPSGLAERPKRGFVLPTARWLTTSLRERAEAVMADRVRWESLGFDPEAVQAVWRRFLARPTQSVATRPWALLSLAAYSDRMQRLAHRTADAA